jgi:hypothetical protein
MQRSKTMCVVARLLDHVVGDCEQRRWHVDGERLGGREINDHVEFCRLRDRQVGRFLAFEDAASIDADELVYVVDARLGLLEVRNCGADFAAYLRKAYDEYGRIIREANIKAR